jgi:hypothetical protein
MLTRSAKGVRRRILVSATVANRLVKIGDEYTAGNRTQLAATVGDTAEVIAFGHAKGDISDFRE